MTVSSFFSVSYAYLSLMPSRQRTKSYSRSPASGSPAEAPPVGEVTGIPALSWTWNGQSDKWPMKKWGADETNDLQVVSWNLFLHQSTLGVAAKPGSKSHQGEVEESQDRKSGKFLLSGTCDIPKEVSKIQQKQNQTDPLNIKIQILNFGSACFGIVQSRVCQWRLGGQTHQTITHCRLG